MVTLSCPICGDTTIKFIFETEPQGEAPMAGYVTFLDDSYNDCSCKLTDEQWAILADLACSTEPDDDGGY